MVFQGHGNVGGMMVDFHSDSSIFVFVLRARVFLRTWRWIAIIVRTMR